MKTIQFISSKRDNAVGEHTCFSADEAHFTRPKERRWPQGSSDTTRQKKAGIVDKGKKEFRTETADQLMSVSGSVPDSFHSDGWCLPRRTDSVRTGPSLPGFSTTANTSYMRTKTWVDGRTENRGVKKENKGMGERRERRERNWRSSR
jgi:hypothetical protein